MTSLIACNQSEMDRSVRDISKAHAESAHYVDSLKQIRLSRTLSPERMEAAEKLGRYYLKHSLDSALTFSRLAYDDAIRLQDQDGIYRLRFFLDAYMPFAGMDYAALLDYEMINPDILTEEQRRIYYLAGSEMYFNIQYKLGNSSFRNYFQQKSIAAIDSVLQYYDKNSVVYQFLSGYGTKLKGDETLAAAIFAELLPKLDDRPDLYMRSAFMLSEYLKNKQSKKKDYYELLEEMTKRSLKEGVVRPAIFAEIGKELCLRGDESRGLSLLSLALTSGNAERGIYAIEDPAEYLSVLAENYGQDRRLSRAIVVASVFCALFFLVFGIMEWRNRSRITCVLKNLSHEFAQYRQQVREELCYSIGLAVQSLDNLQEMNLYTMRKLAAGQAKGLLSELESGKLVQNYRERFFKSFDTYFLEYRPEFIDRLNELLREDARFAPLAQPMLSPELRIAAFMSLGFCDSARLAQALGLSLNTVYTYRNRLKGRAADRVNFEKKLQDLLLFNI